ncbi:DUF3619 family protein [Ideonella livida]|uniref:DUF3619 family protein n=1 Tax=Ideonella livida TaxID=2707176 RepID=A0A7C9TJ60_9BURK|nr:DUF3619 family protein [Ideonella livida]NDY90743.1 DUF3619 family protein [Ideonella livida]
MNSLSATLHAPSIPRSPDRQGADSDTLEAQLAGRITVALSERADELPADIAERLRFAREQAVSRSAVLGRSASRRRHRNLPATPLPAWLRRVASAVPVALLLLGMVAIDEWQHRAEVRAVAEIDGDLLVDDLPVEAYTDPGFLEYLKSQQE